MKRRRVCADCGSETHTRRNHEEELARVVSSRMRAARYAIHPSTMGWMADKYKVDLGRLPLLPSPTALRERVEAHALDELRRGVRVR